MASKRVKTMFQKLGLRPIMTSKDQCVGKVMKPRPIVESEQISSDQKVTEWLHSNNTKESQHHKASARRGKVTNISYTSTGNNFEGKSITKEIQKAHYSKHESAPLKKLGAKVPHVDNVKKVLKFSEDDNLPANTTIYNESCPETQFKRPSSEEVGPQPQTTPKDCPTKVINELKSKPFSNNTSVRAAQLHQTAQPHTQTLQDHSAFSPIDLSCTPRVDVHARKKLFPDGCSYAKQSGSIAGAPIKDKILLQTQIGNVQDHGLISPVGKESGECSQNSLIESLISAGVDCSAGVLVAPLETNTEVIENVIRIEPVEHLSEEIPALSPHQENISPAKENPGPSLQNDSFQLTVDITGAESTVVLTANSETIEVNNNDVELGDEDSTVSILDLGQVNLDNIDENNSHEGLDENLNQKKRTRKNLQQESTPPKKRKVDPSSWKANMAKLAQDSGTAHISLRGKEVRARAVRPGCSAKCRRKCQAKITLAQREIIFRRFWDLKDHSRQWDFIVRLVKMVDIKQRKKSLDEEETPYRKHSYEYQLYDPVTNKHVNVCQTMFLDTLDISVTWIKTAFAKILSSEGKISPDKRGKHKKKKALSTVITNSVIDHIKMFPTIESHYCRAKSRRKYLDENLSISKMHRLYTMERVGQPNTATIRQYRDVFNSNFNLAFYKPKKDQCSQCVAWNSMTEAQKSDVKILSQYNQHKQAKTKVRQLKEEDIKSSQETEEKNIRVCTFDLQKVLYCPKGENSEFFYKRKLACYNFTVFDCTTKEAYCYVWDQTTGQRGSNEMSSFLYDYIEEKSKKGINDFRFYSDACAGQNKNQFLFSMYSLVTVKHNIKITHRWLEKGHTQMECDSVHALIEKKTKNLPIFIPAQWYGHIRAAKVNPPLYTVKEVNQATIFSLKDLASHHAWSKVPIKKIKELTMDSKSPGVAKFRHQFDHPEESVLVLAKKPGRPVNFKTYLLKPAYVSRLPLKPKVLCDLKWLVQKGHIPEAYWHYYNAIPGFEAAPAEAAPEVVDDESLEPAGSETETSDLDE